MTFKPEWNIEDYETESWEEWDNFINGTYDDDFAWDPTIVINLH